MNKIIKNTIIIIVISLALGGLVYKAMSPNDYQDPRYRSNK